MKRKRGQEENLLHSRDERVAKILLYVYALFTVAALLILGKTLYLKLFWKPDSRAVQDPTFCLQTIGRPLKPERGDILDCRGRILATSTPKYNVFMDCAVGKEVFRHDNRINPKTGVRKGEESERKWRAGADSLCRGLAAVLASEGHDPAYYRELIFSGREKNRRHILIAGDINHDKLLALKALPLFNRSSYYGGMIVETIDTRQYPYGTLAQRVIGYVRNNDDGSANSIGIEGSFDWALHGTPGVEYVKATDGTGGITRIAAIGEHSTPAKNGSDITLSIDIDMQDIADRALRRQVEDDPLLADACMIIMEVKTGAIKAMVNLHRGRNGKMNETDNLAVFRVSEPGSVFKTVGLMTMLEDRKVRLETTVPINGGKYSPYPYDDHLASFGRQHHTDRITVREGLEISSNNVYARLATENYGKNPERFIDKIYEYRLGEAYDFDLKGMGKPNILDPRNKASWSGTALGTVAYGYGASVTPLHTVTFYNAIANRGRMMKPYLVERIENEDGTVEKRGPSILNGAICSPVTADSLKSALRSVVTDGTARKLKTASCPIAGKTGTARIVLSADERGGSRNAYQNLNGEFRNQGSFVGFFPVEDPQYTAIVVVYSTLSKTSYFGAQKPADAFKEVVGCLYGMDEHWSGHISRREAMPRAVEVNTVAPAEGVQIVPDVREMGLSDAVFAIENYGYRCSFAGSGRVARQSPAPGSRLKKGETVSIVLQ